MARGRKKKEVEVKDIEEKIEPIEEEIIAPSKEDVRFLECPFCNTKSYTITGRDPTSSWCENCGKCFPAIWKIGS